MGLCAIRNGVRGSRKLSNGYPPKRMVNIDYQMVTTYPVDFSFIGDVDADSHIQMTLNGVEVCMIMRQWHSLALSAVETSGNKSATNSAY